MVSSTTSDRSKWPHYWKLTFRFRVQISPKLISRHLIEIHIWFIQHLFSEKFEIKLFQEVLWSHLSEKKNLIVLEKWEAYEFLQNVNFIAPVFQQSILAKNFPILQIFVCPHVETLWLHCEQFWLCARKLNLCSMFTSITICILSIPPSNKNCSSGFQTKLVLAQLKNEWKEDLEIEEMAMQCASYYPVEFEVVVDFNIKSKGEDQAGEHQYCVKPNVQYGIPLWPLQELSAGPSMIHSILKRSNWLCSTCFLCQRRF